LIVVFNEILGGMPRKKVLILQNGSSGGASVALRLLKARSGTAKPSAGLHSTNTTG